MNAHQAHADILANGGGTFEVDDQVHFGGPGFFDPWLTGGYMVSDADAESVIPLATFTPQSLLHYAEAHSTALHYGFLGAWIHEGNVYLDVSRHYATTYYARSAAEYNSQLAYWDIANGSAVTL